MLIVVLGVIFIPTHFVHAIWPLNNIVKDLFTSIAQLLMMLSSLVLVLCGKLFDWVITFTIIDMAKNIGSAGVGGAITGAWVTLRDVANMLFIFVLLYAAFKAMFDTNFGNFGKTVKDIIIVALLINFSLFFSKVVIDASNIVSVGFYKSIASSGTTLGSSSFTGISAGYMNMLGLQTFYSPKFLENTELGGGTILTIGIMSSVFMLITAIILLMAGVMFVARFIILIFLMILSPLALIAYIIPGQKGQFDKWKDSLIDQSFFAPLYFALTWVVFKLGFSLLKILNDPGKPAVGQWSDITTKPDAVIPLIINYVLISGFSIAALIFAKTMASKTPGFNTITGGISTVAFGGTAWAGRKTIGQAGNYASQNANIQDAAKNKTGFIGAGARLALYASQKARSASFDVRNAAIPTSVVGDTIQGTLGRTKIGKKLGLNDVVIPSIAMSSIVKDMDMLGKGGTKGYKETREESNKRIREREATQSTELTLAQAKKAVKEGADAGATPIQIDDMEKALSKLSDKETEALVASNREILKSQNFANIISVKQLESLNKSDQFSEEEKGKLKNARFSTINSAMASGGGGATIVAKNIKGLSDSELEMINPDHLKNEDFIGQLRPAQAEAIIKSSKFTTSQKDTLKDKRKAPLLNALDTSRPGHVPNPVLVKDMITKRFSPKDVAGLMSTDATFIDHTGTTVTKSVLTHPEILNILTPSLLKRIAPEMNAPDIKVMHDIIENAGTTPGAPINVTRLATWLTTPDGAIFS